MFAVDSNNVNSVFAAVLVKVNSAVKETELGCKSMMSGKSLEFVSTIGVGTFGKISVVKYNGATSCRPLVLKQVAKGNLLESKRGVESAMTERSILRNLNHPFLMKAHETWQDLNYIYFVMDFASGGDVFSKLQKGERFSQKRICQYVAQITLALDYLHSQNVLYRDVKAENVLIDSQGFIKLTDFGLSKFCNSVEGHLRAFTICGTPEYMAPEIIENHGEGYGRKADWWAVGVLMYEMMYAMPPFYHHDPEVAVRIALTEDVRFPHEPQFSPECKHFVSELLAKDEFSRLGNTHIFSHVFLNQVNLDDVYDRKITPEYTPVLDSTFDCSNFDSAHDIYMENDIGDQVLNIPGFQWLPSTAQKVEC